MSMGGRGERAEGTSQSLQLREHVAALLAEFDDLLAREAELRGEVDALRAELERAQAAVSDASRARAAFVSHMSHEILTPLNAVVGLAEQLYDGATSGEQRELARGVRAGGEHLTRMLGGILELSRIESDAHALARRPFDLVAEVERAVDGAAPFAASRRVELCMTASERARVQVVGDAGRLRLVIGNAVDDAAKSGEAGDVEVAVDVVGRTDEAVEVIVDVRDHGPGSASRKDASGLGIGMTICARMCELMGGSMTLADHPEGGAVVRMRVRLALATGQTEPKTVDLRGRRIRVVTASAGLRATIGGWLARWQAQAVEDGYDLVIADAAAAGAVRGVPVVVLDPVGPRATPGPSAVARVSRPVHEDGLAAAIVAAYASTARASEPTAQAEVRGLRLLIAEDNPFNQRVLVGALRKLGYAADVVMDGRAAVEAVAAKPYDLVLMDLMMPELDGLAATREICGRWSVEERPRIVAVTAQVSEEERAACMAAGMVDFLTKPLDTQRLAALLQGCPRRG